MLHFYDKNMMNRLTFRQLAGKITKSKGGIRQFLYIVIDEKA